MPRPRLFLACAGACAVLSALAGSSSAGRATPIAKARWLDRVLITEYYPVPERWFRGKLISAPGLTGKHRADWLYGGGGVSMEGDGIGLDGGRYHIYRTGDQGWVDEHGKPTVPGVQGWSRGFPFWRGVGWRNRRGQVTFPLAGGGWFRGAPKRYIGPAGIEFGTGPSRPLDFWRSIAVDPSLIPMGSRVFVPELCGTPGRGWTIAEDIGGAIIGRHIDVYRPAPAGPHVKSDVWRDARIFAIPPEAKPPKRLPRCGDSGLRGAP
ncbi:MAG: hypothetical protein H0W36_11070 [Gemmatimonadetes bacterium]|nr:hypothetical protein [Gemmatimonadota bacterium]